MGNINTEQGEIIHIGEVQAFGDKGYKKLDLVVRVPDENDSKYDQPVKFTVSGKPLEKFQECDFRVGDYVSVEYRLRGNQSRKDPTLYFVELSVWNVDQAGQRRHQKGRPTRREDPPQREYKLGKPRNPDKGVEAHWSPGGRNEEDDIPF